MLISTLHGAADFFLVFIPFVFICSVSVFYQGRNLEGGPAMGSVETAVGVGGLGEES